MKNTFYLITLLLSVMGYSQSQAIKNIKTKGAKRAQANEYYKDLDFELNNFEGTWVYSNGYTYLKFVMFKKVNQYNGLYYEDMIIGGYEYKVNGVTLVNTLADIDTVYPNQWKHYLVSIGLVNKNANPPCQSCSQFEYRLFMKFSEPSSVKIGNIYMRKFEDGIGQEKIIFDLRETSSKLSPEPDDFVVPTGVYTLIKQ